MSVASAFYTRWNNAGLDNSIATLYFGEQQAPPAETGTTRANYFLETETDQPGDESPGYRIKVTPVRVQIWSNSGINTVNNVTTIEEQYVNSHKASSNPLDIGDSEATVIDVVVPQKDVRQVAEDTYVGEVLVEVHWQQTNAVPS